MHQHHSHKGPQGHHMAFAISVSLNIGFVIIEAVYALLANSMSLFADAGHNLGDVVGLLLAWMASWLLSKGANRRLSYGYKKTTILAALANAILLVGTSAVIAYESILKLQNPVLVDEVIVISVAAIGIVINGGTALLFMRGREHDLNIKGAFLHLAADALISLGVVFSGIIIFFFKVDWLDPVVGLIIVIAILVTTWGLLRDSINLLLAGVPTKIDLDKVRDYLCSLEGVEGVHDLHVWGLSTSESALTAHLIMPGGPLSDARHKTINQYLLETFAIGHVTIQVENAPDDDPCGQQNACH